MKRTCLSRLRLLLASIAAVSASGAVARPAAEDWWDTKWQCRRTAVVSCAGDRGPGNPAGWVRFRTGGAMRPDGADVRVVCEGRTVSHRVLFVGPGDVCLVAFEAKPSRPTYQIYYGNPRAKADKVRWEPKRGLLLETRAYNGGGCKNWQQMQHLLKRSRPPMGRGFVKKIFHGHNLFGPTEGYVSIYRGWINCPRSGRYVFFTTSGDGSFLFVDGRRVAHWGGWHRPIPKARFRGKINLKKGVHRIEYYNVRRYYRAAAVAASLPPWAKKPAVIPGSAFARVYEGKLISHEVQGREIAPDFRVNNLGEAFLGSRCLIRMEFRDVTSGKHGTKYRAAWSFGDGTRGRGPTAEHIYVSPGLYKIGLSLEVAGRTYTCAQKVQVDRAWAAQPTRRPEDAARYHTAVRAYDLKSMAPTSLAAAVWFFGELDKTPDVLRAGTILLERADKLNESQRLEALLLLGRTFRDKVRNYTSAEQVFKKGERLSANVTNKAKFRFEIGDLCFYYYKNLRRARSEYKAAVGQYARAHANTLRLTRIRIGDTYLYEGDYDGAMAAYKRAKTTGGKQLSGKDYLKGAVSIGARALEVEDYLRRGELDAAYEQLSAWQWQNPEEKLRGQWSTLMARWAMAKRDHREAVKQIENLLRVNPKSHYAPEALMVLATAYQKLGQSRKAIDALETLKSD